jgi:hypothetical protein
MAKVDSYSAETQSKNWNYDGFTSLRWRSRSGGGERDRDFFQTLYVDVKQDKQKPRWNFVALGQLSKDLDVGQGFSEFADLYDSFGGRTDTRLYFAYLDVHNLGFVSPKKQVKRVRLGRQDLLGTGQSLNFDGVRLDSKIFKKYSDLQFSIYGGTPVDYYESDSSESLLGLVLQGKPRDDLRLRVDWMEVMDEHSQDSGFWPGVLAENRDDLLSLSGWYSGLKNIKVYSRYSILDSDAKKIQLRGTYSRPDKDLIAKLSYTQLKGSLLQHSNELDPFFTTLSALRPYHHTQIHIWKGLSDRTSLDAGFSVRLLEDSRDDSLYNHGFKNYYLSHNTTGLRGGDIDLTFTLSGWSASGRNDSFTYGGEINYHGIEDWAVSGGVYYDLYKYNDIVARNTLAGGSSFVTVEEKEDIYTYFVQARWRRTKHQFLKLRFEYEDGQFESYKTVSVGYTYRF